MNQLRNQSAKIAKKLRNGIANLALICAGLAIGLAIAELVLRFFFPFATFGGGQELDWFRKGPALPLVVLDPTLGFRPVLNNGVYDDSGIMLATSMRARVAPAATILFMGDSVTARGRIVRQTANLLGVDDVDYINGGVEAYNVQQEVEFFFRYQAKLRPRHIIHILHVNDLQSTPIAYRDPDGQLNVYAMYGKREALNPWLYEHLYLYRWALALALPRLDPSDIAAQAGRDLERMRKYAAQTGSTYEVALFPILAPYEKWSPYERLARDLLLAAARSAGVQPLDLLPLSEQMNAAGVEIIEKRSDYWHPNDAFAAAVAQRFLHAFDSLKSLNRRGE